MEVMEELASYVNQELSRKEEAMQKPRRETSARDLLNKYHEAEPTRREQENALKGDEDMLIKMKADLQKLERGEPVPNLTVAGAKSQITGLEAVFKNKKKMLGLVA